jgi:putative oxidoreductase
MTRFLGSYSEVAYLLMRIVFAFLYLAHGLKWLFGAFGGRPVPLTPLLTTAGVLETIGGIAMLLGFLTPWFAFIASGEMAFAYFIAHVPRGGIIPIENGGEITVALCFGFLYMATRDSGPFSLDAALRSRRR